MKILIIITFIFLSSTLFGQTKQVEPNTDSSKAVKDSIKYENPFTMSSKTAWILTSNFTVPTVTFQPVIKDYREKNIGSSRGDLSFFNAIGAGLSISRANFKLLSSKDDTVGTDINNQIGFQIGFLFSRTSIGTTSSTAVTTPNTAGTNNTAESNIKNRFALQMGISILDFQIGFGKEFINVPENYNSKFITISYGIPVSKFTRKTAFVFKNRGPNSLRKISKIDRGFSI